MTKEEEKKVTTQEAIKAKRIEILEKQVAIVSLETERNRCQDDLRLLEITQQLENEQNS